MEADARSLPDLLQTARTEGYDLAVVDTPPAVSFDTAQIAAAVDLVVIPLQPSILDIYAVESTAAVVTASATPALLVLNACMPPTERIEASSTRQARADLKGLPIPVAKTSLAYRIDYVRALNEGSAVHEFAPSSRAAPEMQRLWHEIKQELSSDKVAHEPRGRYGKEMDGHRTKAG